MSFEMDHGGHTIVFDGGMAPGDFEIAEVRCPREEPVDVWLARDSVTSRVVAFGWQEGPVREEARTHKKLSGNRVRVGKLKVGMVLKK